MVSHFVVDDGISEHVEAFTNAHLAEVTGTQPVLPLGDPAVLTDQQANFLVDKWNVHSHLFGLSYLYEVYAFAP